jgi:hypothetical protein
MDQYRIYPSTPLVSLVACDNTDDGEIADRCKGEKVAGHAMRLTEHKETSLPDLLPNNSEAKLIRSKAVLSACLFHLPSLSL